MEFSVTSFTEHERDMLVEFWLPLWLDLCDSLGFSPDETLIRERSETIQSTLIAISTNRRILGTLEVVEGELRNFYVSPKGQGVGTKLLEEAVTLGANHLWVDENNLEARGFYESQRWFSTGVWKLGDVFPSTVLQYALR